MEAGAILETLALEYAKDPALRSLDVPSPQPSGATEAMEVESEAGSATAEETDAEAIADEVRSSGESSRRAYDDGDGDDASSSGSSPPVSKLDHDDHPDEPAPQEDDEAEVV